MTSIAQVLWWLLLCLVANLLIGCMPQRMVNGVCEPTIIYKYKTIPALPMKPTPAPTPDISLWETRVDQLESEIEWFQRRLREAESTCD